MQIYNLHIYQKMPLTPTLFAKQGDIGRKFKAVITDGTDGYTIPADAVLSVWFSGASGEGNYSSIGDRSAFTVSGNTVEVELIAQMLKNKGQGALCLVMNSADGFRIGTWNIPYEVEAVPGMGSAPADPTPDIYAQILAAYAQTQSRLSNLYMCATDDGTGIVTLDFENKNLGNSSPAYELLETITIAENNDITTIVRDNYNLDAIMVRITTPAADASDNVKVQIFSNDKTIAMDQFKISATGNQSVGIWDVYKSLGAWVFIRMKQSPVWAAPLYTQPRYYKMFSTIDYPHITKLSIALVDTLPVGTTIEIYGVKA